MFKSPAIIIHDIVNPHISCKENREVGKMLGCSTPTLLEAEHNCLRFLLICFPREQINRRRARDKEVYSRKQQRAVLGKHDSHPCSIHVPLSNLVSEFRYAQKKQSDSVSNNKQTESLSSLYRNRMRT